MWAYDSVASEEMTLFFLGQAWKCPQEREEEKLTCFHSSFCTTEDRKYITYTHSKTPLCSSSLHILTLNAMSALSSCTESCEVCH